MRKKLLNGRMIGILAVLLALFTAVGVAEEERADERTDATGQWRYVLEDDGATITGHVGLLAGDLSIPGELDGLHVTAIGEYAFESSTPERIILPDTVISIGDRAFARCFSLTEITLPESLISIGDGAFAESSLGQITLPGSLAFIGEDGFYGYANLTLTVTEGSYAEQYAKENGIPYALP